MAWIKHFASKYNIVIGTVKYITVGTKYFSN